MVGCYDLREPSVGCPVRKEVAPKVAVLSMSEGPDSWSAEMSDVSIG